MCSAVVPEGSYEVVGNASLSVEDREEERLWVIADDGNGMVFFHGTDQLVPTNQVGTVGDSSRSP
jgi:hypothetical protein